MNQTTVHQPGLFWRKIVCRMTLQQLIAEDTLSFLCPHLIQDSLCPDPLKNRVQKSQRHQLDTNGERDIYM